jgi:hypothetical protein
MGKKFSFKDINHSIIAMHNLRKFKQNQDRQWKARQVEAVAEALDSQLWTQNVQVDSVTRIRASPKLK